MISKIKWQKYLQKMAAVDEKAAELMRQYIEANGLENKAAVVSYAYDLTSKYGEVASELACEMYDLMAETQGAVVPPAEPADTATLDEVTRGVMYGKYHSPNQIPSIVGRQVRQAGADTMLKNAIRDQVEWAWIPSGDTCAFCITLASRGWQRASKKVLKGDHAEHIHANCDCTFGIAFNEKGKQEYDYIYDPHKYAAMYYGADGRTPTDKINSIRRARYQLNKDYINAQKRDAYQARQILLSGERPEVSLGSNSNPSDNRKPPIYYETTDEWNEKAKPTAGAIKSAPYTTTLAGDLYREGDPLPDGKIVKLKKEDGDDLKIGKWFKNHLWGDVVFQRGVEYPLGIRSADLLLHDCPLIDTQTIEIKTVKSKRSDGFIRRIKDANGQSPNVMVDISNYDYGIDFIKSEVAKAYEKLYWLDSLIVKKGDEFVAYRRSK